MQCFFVYFWQERLIDRCWNIIILLKSINQYVHFVWWLISGLFSPHISNYSELQIVITEVPLSGLSVAPVVKPSNLIPPNVSTSRSSYMSHNIIRAIFSHSSQSLSDRFHITNRKNMCPYISVDFTAVCQEQVRNINTNSTCHDAGSHSIKLIYRKWIM